MSFTSGIVTRNRLAADQVVTASVTLVTLSDFTFNLGANKVITISGYIPFSVGASGGFKFQVTSAQTLVDYQVGFEAIDGVTASPGAQVAVDIVAQAAFANAFAVAGNHILNFNASLKGHATLASLVSFQFACNSAANAITCLKGGYIELAQY